jgi:hypothetical protein
MGEAPKYTDGFAPFLSERNSLRNYLASRERELTSQIAGLRGQIAPKEQELAEVKLAIAALPPALPSRVARIAAAARDLANTPLALSHAAVANVDLGLYQRTTTIKEHVVQSLLDHFQEGGSSADIREFIRDAYGRTIEPSSLRPQMHRLKSAGVLAHDPSADIWNLTQKARHAYTLFGRPTSTELQDDPPTEE